MKLELAKTGNHNGITITEDDIREMEQTFCGDVPVTIGHEMDDSMPAYGWVMSLEVSDDGQTLAGELELGDELAESFGTGKYKNWSIGAGRNDDEKMYLHHVAFLGAVPPMIKDLKVIEMGDVSDIVTFTAAGCSLILSDAEASEYISLKKEKMQSALTKLSDAAAGKIPFGMREHLIRFADEQMRNTGDSSTAELLTEIFSSVKSPVKEGLSAAITTKRADTGINLFRKI
ncbi:MAG: hypothetical protein C0602_12830 [Denitrovibrio sp.]|nr:MAG: hypothetical protein C0602_12830 [Denitrovibrio sp.]